MFTFTNFIYSPLEQFTILPLFSISTKWYDVSITNEVVIALIVLFFWAVLFTSLSKDEKDSSFLLIPNEWQAAMEMFYKTVLTLVKSNIKNEQGIRFFPLIFFIFFTIISLNVIGLVPYSFTLTSHIIVTLSISLSIFIGIVIISIKKHGLNFLLLFKPSGISLELLFLLTPIEVISFIFKPISLAIRLFANMMAGHTLLKVIAGFAFTLANKSGVLFILHLAPLLILVPLYGLELAVAFIQSFVFSILICIYINEGLNLH